MGARYLKQYIDAGALMYQTDMFEAKEPATAVAFGGALPCGACCLVAPWPRRQLIELDPENEAVSMLMPGDVIVGSYPEGIAAKAYTEFTANTQLPFPGGTWAIGSQGFQQRPKVELAIYSDETTPQKLTVRKLPGSTGRFQISNNAMAQGYVDNETDFGWGTGTIIIPTAAKTVGIQITGTELVVPNPIRLDGNVEVEVWWMGEGRLWCHNESDDFDAAGRGVATINHDAEVYELGGGVRAVHLRLISESTTGTPQASVVFGW